MRRFAASLLLVLAGLCVLAALSDPSSGPPKAAVDARALTAAVWLGTDRPTVGPRDAFVFRAWLNVSGSGQFQAASLTLGFASYPNRTWPAFLLGPGGATAPPECTSAGSGAWTCTNLRGGNAYGWTIPATVSADASVGYSQLASATAVTQSGTSTQTLVANASVYIAGAVLAMPIGSIPAYTARAGDLITFWINVTNVAVVNESQSANATAWNVALSVTLGPGLRLGPGSPSLTTTAGNLTPQSVLAVSIQALVEGDATPGTVVGIVASLTYEDFNGHPLAMQNRSVPIYIRAGDVVSPPNLIAGAAIGLGAIVATLLILVYLGQRELTLDEVFLLHRSGSLIRHAGGSSDAAAGDDRIGPMFVAIQEFIRDTFKTDALVEELSFGDRKVAVVRGQHTFLAAVLSRGEVEFAIPQMLAAVRSVEAMVPAELEAGEGAPEDFAAVDLVLERLLRGGFRSAWRANLT